MKLWRKAEPSLEFLFQILCILQPSSEIYQVSFCWLLHNWYSEIFVTSLLSCFLYIYIFSCDQAALRTLLSVCSSSVTPFYPRPVLAFGYCRCLRVCLSLSVCLSVCHFLGHAKTRDPFKLGSPNLDQRCKRPCLRFLLFCGLIDLDLQGQI